MKGLTTITFALVSLAATAHAGDPAKGAPAPPAATEMPKPPQELADMAKQMAGTWKCTGQAEIGGQMLDVKATITHKLDLDNWWVQSTFTGTAAKMPPFKFTAFTTYDAANKKWFRTMVNGHGGHTTAWGTASGTKVTWEGDARFGGADLKIRETEDASPKEVHIVGEYSKDGGKTWNKDHDATCKK
jgi:uncharacterized protein DUF1579